MRAGNGCAAVLCTKEGSYWPVEMSMVTVRSTWPIGGLVGGLVGWWVGGLNKCDVLEGLRVVSG